MTVPADRRTPTESLLVDALADVIHVGDYGTLWVHEDDRRVHLTMGDADGDEERGVTGFDEIACRVEAALANAWPGWTADPARMFEHDGAFTVGAEYDPVDEHGQDGWSDVGGFGRVVTALDELRGYHGQWNGLRENVQELEMIEAWARGVGESPYTEAANLMAEALPPMRATLEQLRDVAGGDDLEARPVAPLAEGDALEVLRGSTWGGAWHRLISVSSSISSVVMWKFEHNGEDLVAAYRTLGPASKPLHRAVELLRPIAKPEQAR